MQEVFIGVLGRDFFDDKFILQPNDPSFVNF